MLRISIVPEDLAAIHHDCFYHPQPHIMMTGWPWAITHPRLPQIRACGHYRTRLLKILFRYVILFRIIFY